MYYSRHMSQSSPVASTEAVVPPLTSLPLRSATERQSLRDVLNSVRTLNEAGVAGEGREIAFSIDRATRLPVVKVVDVNSKEVVVQWPADYVLRLAANIEKQVRIQDEPIL